MTERQKDILFAIIEEYAETATAIGSITLAKLFDVSSATIRSEMALLEKMGLIAQPHTSAGRIPTDAGYRLYVNSLIEESENEEDYEPTLREQITDKYERPLHALALRVNSHPTRHDQTIRSAVDGLAELTGNLGVGTIGNQLYMSGLGHLFSQPEFSEADNVKAVAKLLDNLEPWLREAAPGHSLNIFIGQENPIGKSSGVSLIVSKFRSPFSNNSYIGVLGPTRQTYEKTMSLVQKAGKMLEEFYG